MSRFRSSASLIASSSVIDSVFDVASLDVLVAVAPLGVWAVVPLCTGAPARWAAARISSWTCSSEIFWAYAVETIAASTAGVAIHVIRLRVIAEDPCLLFRETNGHAVCADPQADDAADPAESGR